MVSLVVGFIGILIVLLGHIPFWPGTADSIPAMPVISISASGGSSLAPTLAAISLSVMI